MVKNDSKPHEKDGKRLKRVRRLMGITQSQLATLLGCSIRTVRNHEKSVTETPQSHRRIIGKLTNVDIAPLDAEEDPKLIDAQYYFSGKAGGISKVLAQNKVDPTLEASIWRLRSWNIFRNEQILSTWHRRYDNAVSFGYFLVTTIFTMEQFQRIMNGGWSRHHFLHDLLYVASFSLLVVLTIPAIMTISWKVSDELVKRWAPKLFA